MVLLIRGDRLGDGALSDRSDDHPNQISDDERDQGTNQNRVGGVAREQTSENPDGEGREGATGGDDLCSDSRGHADSLRIQLHRQRGRTSAILWSELSELTDF